MSEQSSFFSDTKQEIEAYIKDRILLLKLQTAEKTSRVITVLISIIIIGLFSFFILLFISIMLGFLFASITGSNYIGFGIVAALYILLLIIIIRFKHKVIDTFIVKSMIDIFLSDTTELNENDATNTTN